MACSCKQRNITDTQITQQADGTSKKEVAKTKATYDFSTTTKPLQTCAYCASKHISLALALLKKNTTEDTLIALGQLMAALYHYNTKHVLQTQGIKEVLDTIINDKFKITQQLLVKLEYLAIQAINIKDLPEGQQKVPDTAQYSRQQALKHACLAYSLLFTQLFYETINRPYVVGELILAALHLQAQDRDSAKKLRQIWKVVQQIKTPNDQDYLKSRSMLMDFLKELQQSLIIIV